MSWFVGTIPEGWEKIEPSEEQRAWIKRHCQNPDDFTLARKR